MSAPATPEGGASSNSATATQSSKSQGSQGLRLRVVRRTELAQGVLGLDLESADGRPLPDYQPGAHLELRVPGGLKRHYSLHRPADGRTYSIGVLHAEDSRGGSRALHEVVHEGDVLESSEPRNHFALRPDDGDKPVLLLAAGIGITPIIAMAEALDQAGKSFELHYVARTPQRMAFAERIRSSHYGSHAHLYFHDAHAPQKDFPQLDLRSLLRKQTDSTQVYVCGPQGFIKATVDAANELKWSKERVTYELFGAAQPAQMEAEDTSFEVELTVSGKVIRIAPDKTIVEAMLEEGLEPNTSCEQGVCGTCLTRVLAGTPDHRDSFLTDEEKGANDQMLICCSRSTSPRLVLEL